MDFHTFIMIKTKETKIDLKVAAEKMDVKYKSLYTRLRAGKVTIEEILQLSDIYKFTLDDMKSKIEYRNVIL